MPLSNPEYHAVHEWEVLKTDQRYDISCIDLFAGCGGTALGFENAGLKHVLMVERDKSAYETLSNNLTSETCDIICGDVADVRYKPYADNVDVVQAGFPCQAFSYAGHRLGFDDVRGTMFFEFARCIKEVRPKISIGENVKGLMTHDGGRTLDTMLNVLDELGYDVDYRILDAQHYDVPQHRERLILMATKRDTGIKPIWPKPTDYIITVREALRDVPASDGMSYSESKKSVLSLVPEGGNWRDLPLDMQKAYLGKAYNNGGGKTGMAKRLAWDEPSKTLTCSPIQKMTERCHPSETRPLTVREYARIQTFPDEYEFCGTLAAQYKQIGNAVPPNLAYHIARCIPMILGMSDVDDTVEYGKADNKR